MSTSVTEAKTRLIEKVRKLAYIHSPDELFTLASGRQSPHFFDMKPVIMDPESAHLLGVLIHSKINSMQKIDAVGGLELGAIPLTGIAIAKHLKIPKLGDLWFVKKLKGEEVGRQEIRLESKVLA